ncbi:FAD-dependent oxidoreductase [Actinopolymorpha alba]|uniref:FAD-dependent oxidoreductase n=1 Tax=Actinopolymorpha alba TaxID=533267 RepID=UPI0012F6835E|nr:FAD-dependent oxidoreductase [Actinopolymorpha alba]
MSLTRRSVLGAGLVGAAGAALGAGATLGIVAATGGPDRATSTRDTNAATGQQRGVGDRRPSEPAPETLRPDVLVAGGGVGGVAAALALLRAHRTVVLTEPTGWIGGQLTSQGVPPDEHTWIEDDGIGATASYLEMRRAVREEVRRTYPLTDVARRTRALDPGKAWAAKLCAEPTVWHAVLRSALAPYEATNRLRLLTHATPVHATVSTGTVRAVRVRTPDGDVLVEPAYVIDATELGDLLPLTGAAYVVGREKGGPRERGGTGELHNVWDSADPSDQQAFTMVAALGYAPSRPWERVTSRAYDEFAPIYAKFGANGKDVFDPSRDWAWEKARNFWAYRRVRYHGYLRDAFLGDITLLNQKENDHVATLLIPPHGRLDPATFTAAVARASGQTRGLVEYFQRHYPRPDGSGRGWPGIFLVPHALGTPTGLAAHPYVRESRRGLTAHTITEEQVGVAARTKVDRAARTAMRYVDSVGIGAGPIDIHQTRAHPSGLFLETYPFEIPYRALVPRGFDNFLLGAKNIGTTHFTNGCYRYHPVEWSIGEAAGHAVAFALRNELQLNSLRRRWPGFAAYLDSHGVRRHWPDELARVRVDSFHV